MVILGLFKLYQKILAYYKNSKYFLGCLKLPKYWAEPASLSLPAAF